MAVKTGRGLLPPLLDWPVFLAGFVRDELFYQLGDYRLARAPAPTRYLSPTGLALSCDAYGGEPYVMSGMPEHLDLSSYRAIRDGAVIWMRIEGLQRFNREVLPGLKSRFVLVTGESDWSVPSSFPQDAQTVLESGKLLHWFSVNYDGPPDDRITPMPIGIEYPKRNEITVSLRAGSYCAFKKSPEQHEAEWDRLAAHAPPLQQRVRLASADFHFHNTSANRRFGESREDIRDRLRDNPNIAWARRRQLSPLAPRRRYLEHAFVIVTYGRGLDGHRTWEALQLGCIVIVKKGPLDVLYQGLPVVSLDRWEDITADNMQRWYEQYGPEFDRAPVHRILSMKHWTDRIRAAARTSASAD